MADTENLHIAENEEVTPGQLSWREVAESAYRAYGNSTGNKNFRGEPMPAFAALPIPIQTAWEAAARQVGICLEYGSAGLEAEASWTGWVPPVV